MTVHSDIEVSLAVDTSISQALSFVNELVGTDTPAAVDVYVSTNGDYLVGEYGARAGAVDPMAAEVLGRSDTGIGYPGALFVNTSTANTGLIAHEYFHVVQHHLIGTTGNQGFAMPVWLSEAPAGIVTERSRLNPPVRFDAVEARRAVSEHPGEYPGMQAWEHSSGGFYADGNNYRTAAGLLSLYTEERGLTDSAWATDLWNAYAANGADWRAAWLQVYGAPAEEFYAWADMTVVALGAG